MNISVAFSICSFLFIILTSIVYFTKEKINNFENKLYKILLLLNIIGLVIDIGGFFSFSKLGSKSIINIIIAKVYLIYYISYVYCLLNYVCNLSFNNIQKKLKSLLKYYVLMVLVILALPIHIKIENHIMYTYGTSVNFNYTIGFLFVGIMLFLIIKHHKNFKKNQLFLLTLFIVFTALAAIIQKINPRITLMITANSLVTFLMYNTIENPDVKMIKQLELAKESAEKANRAKSDFLSSMSHEIRTPLNAIVGLSDDILTYDNVPDEVKEDSKDIVEASHTLLEIVGNILDINKIESEKMKLVESVYNFKEELNSIAKINKVRIGDKPIQYNVNIADDIPDYLYGDRTHIKQVLNNLISNAIKYTDKGFININAKCINKNDMCLLIISVQDTGKGIKAEDIGKLFTKFERLDIEKNSTVEGTGLGLAITKKLVEMMNGKINVSSNYNQGSIFMVQIPQRIHTKEMPDIDLKSKEENNEDNYKNKKVLIVDDNALNIKVAKIALRDFDMEIDECNDGLSCLEKVKQKKYDVILMDIMMPNMSGETALLKLKEIPEFNTPVIALTADAITGAKEKYIEEGFVDYIAKPFRKDEIKEKLDKIFIKKEN